MTAWLKQNVVAIVAALATASMAYAATESRLAVLEEKTKGLEDVRRNVAAICERVGANCK